MQYGLIGILIWGLGRFLKVEGLTVGRSFAALLLSILASLLIVLPAGAAIVSAGWKNTELVLGILSYLVVNILLVLLLRRLGGATWRQAIIIALIALLASEIIDRLVFSARLM